MKKRFLAILLVLVVSLALTVPAFADDESIDLSGNRYLTVSKNPISWVSITGRELIDNDIVSVHVAMLLADGTVITANIPEGEEEDGSSGLLFLFHGAGSGDPGLSSFSEPAANHCWSAYWYRDEGIICITETYAAALTAEGHTVKHISSAEAAKLDPERAGKIIRNLAARNQEGDSKPTTPQPTESPAKAKTAIPTNDKLSVNGELAEEATIYKIGGNNYFKLRDVAALLNGTSNQFNVGYENGTVIITTGQGYSKLKNDLKGAAKSDKKVVSGDGTILIDGVQKDLKAYKIGGNNYFKLRDLGKALGFTVDYKDGVAIIVTN